MPGYATVEIVIDSLVFSLALLVGTEHGKVEIFSSPGETTKGYCEKLFVWVFFCKEGSAGATLRVSNNLRWGSAK